MILTLSDLSQEPLHAQISRQIRTHILAHSLIDDEALPSIRTLAREQRVSVITVQRAYEDLEHEGLIRSRPGKGFFVVAISEDRKHEVAEQRFAAAIAPIVEESLKAGLDGDQIRAAFENVLARSEHGGTE